ncbi:Glycosyltransferase involved in cell wall bisynthesis [Micromonospora nigra]|uniref:Glycosyltransferase involved in cell wall bisynthesis n=1 Tax=Micromonospora nigra TaxID=145857 RepID=A0A1C6SVW0_9ACTN|nr:glycosyltransferase [Micromonospora nigra]SCL33627.1 Glycosyltransferase involved in cell wall bisynthesis [Micromonospora nigra]
MSAAPTVAVVIPVYNAAKTLRQCLASVYAQTHPPVEVVVVDDGSTDGSPAVAAEFGCRLVVQPVNAGVSAARNAGVAASTSEVVFFVDSDVALAPDAVAAALAELAAHPDCGCVYGVYAPQPLIDDGPVERYRVLHLHHALSRAAGPVDSAIFALAAVPRRVLDTLGGFDEKLRSAEDDEYSERLLTRHDIRISTAVRGWHDEADRLLPLLDEQFRRAQLMPFSLRNRYRSRGLVFNPTLGVLAAGLTPLTVPAVLLHPVLALLPLLCLVGFVAADRPLFRLLRRTGGWRFLGLATGVHLLVNLAMIAGALVGAVRVVLDPSFGPSGRSARPAARPVDSKGW